MRVDIALPVESTLAELVPALVQITGAAESATATAPAMGWALSRLDGRTLEAGTTVTGAGIRDGDVIYLRPRTRTAAPLLFDDVVDAIASMAETRAGAWRATVARRSALVAAVVAFAGAALLVVAGSAHLAVAAVSSAGLAVALLVGGAALARAYGDVDAGAACAAGGALAALLAGFAAAPNQHGWALRPGPVSTALAAVAVYGVLAAVLLADHLAEFCALAVAGAGGAVVAAVVVLVPVRPVSGCAVAVAAVTLLSAAAPMLALRLGRLPLPRVPSDVAAFRRDEQAIPGPDVLDRTTAAEQILTGLLTACGAVSVGCAVVLVRFPSHWSWALAGLAGLVWVLRSRAYAGTMQRVALLTAGIATLTLLGGRIGVSAPRTALPVVAGVVALVGVGCLAYASRVIRTRRSPHLSRLLDVTESLSLVALLPVAAAVVGLYDAARGVGH